MNGFTCYFNFIVNIMIKSYYYRIYEIHMTMICAKSLNAGVGCLLYIALSLVELRRWGEYLEGSGWAS